MAVQRPETTPGSRFRDVVETYMASQRFQSTTTHSSIEAVAVSQRALWARAVGQVRSNVSLWTSSEPARSGSTAIVEQTIVPMYDGNHPGVEMSYFILLTGDRDEIYQDADLAKKNFQQALVRYEQEAPAKSKTNINVRSHHTWDDVLQLTTDALTSHNDDSGFSGKMRKMLRKIGKNSEMMTAWSSLLPSQSEYFSLLCGGLKIIITAAARLRNICEELTIALEEIPDLLSWAHGSLTAFKSSSELHRCSADFYMSVLACMDCMVTYLSKRSTARFFGAVFKVDGFATNLEDKIAEARRKSDAFKQCAVKCSYVLIADTHSMVKNFANDSRQLQMANGRELADLRRDNYEQNSTIYHQIKFGQDHINQQLEETLTRTLAKFFASNTKIDYVTHAFQSEPLALRRSASDSDRLNRRSRAVRKRLLDTLNYDEAMLGQDLGANLRQDFDASLRSEDRVMALMGNPRLRSWLASTSSEILFVNGNHVASEHQPPTSFVSARLAAAIRNSQPAQRRDRDQSERPKALALSHFCAAHKHPKDTDAGPDGMLRSFIAQLLNSWPNFDLAIIERLRNIDHSDVDDLQSTFELLLDQLPSDVVVFCVLDSITVLEERMTWKKDAIRLMISLDRLVEKHNKGNWCVLKLLMTSPTNSRSLCRELPTESVIWMPESVPRQGTFTERAWKLEMTGKLPGTVTNRPGRFKDVQSSDSE